MRAAYNISASKRAVNLSLNEDLITQVRGVTDNLSEVVESLLAGFLTLEMGRRAAGAEALKEAIQTWNAFAEKHGSFADEHSTL
jgi:post-segregation antitoxin (ccd killing protein)